VNEPELLVADLHRVRLLIEQGDDVRPEPRPVVGRAAVIRRGALAGLRGVVTKVNSSHRLTVMVNFMQQGASMTIDEADVDLVD
jgi:transcription antitermination factor NusG